VRDGTVAAPRRRRLRGRCIVEGVLRGTERVQSRARQGRLLTVRPDVLRAFVAGDRFSEVLDGLDAAAPAEIAEDVRADSEWFRTRWSDVVAQYDYDLRRIYLDGTPEDLAVFNRSHPDVVEHASCTTAYEDQLCGG
jgi:hypothetical protein